MNARKPTRIGVAPPQSVNTRPSGRYKVQAPDALVGSILRVKIDNSQPTTFVEVVLANEKRLFITVDGEPINFCDWDYANREEVAKFKYDRYVGYQADQAELRGIPAFVLMLREIPKLNVAALLRSVSDELIRRGKNGKASQISAYLIFEEER